MDVVTFFSLLVIHEQFVVRDKMRRIRDLQESNKTRKVNSAEVVCTSIANIDSYEKLTRETV